MSLWDRAHMKCWYQSSQYNFFWIFINKNVWVRVLYWGGKNYGKATIERGWQAVREQVFVSQNSNVWGFVWWLWIRNFRHSFEVLPWTNWYNKQSRKWLLQPLTYTCHYQWYISWLFGMYSLLNLWLKCNINSSMLQLLRRGVMKLRA